MFEYLIIFLLCTLSFLAGCLWIRRGEATEILTSFPLTLKKLDQLLRNNPDAVLYCMRLDGTFAYISPNSHIIAGFNPEEMINHHYTEFVHPDDHNLCELYLSEVTNGNTPRNVTYRLQHKDGKVSWNCSTINPYTTPAGEVVLLIGLGYDVSELKQTQEELDKSNRKLAQLLRNRESELLTATEEALCSAEAEARRIGEHIHDDLCHDLIALSHLAERIHIHKEDCCHQCISAFEQIRQQSNSLAVTARTYSHELALYELENQSLPEALESLAQTKEQLFDIVVETNIDSNSCPSLSKAQINHIYRIVRESISNARRHAKAGHIAITMIPESDRLVFSITNDGTPLPPEEAITPGLGMRQIQMRTRLLGGSYSLSSEHPSGTTVAELVIPIPEKDHL